MPVIQELRAIEILDSRGKPTVKATCTLKGGATASASVPSGGGGVSEGNIRRASSLIRHPMPPVVNGLTGRRAAGRRVVCKTARRG